MLLPFDHSFVSELQQEGISRYDCDSQKCDIALRAICLKTFGGRSCGLGVVWGRVSGM